MKQRHNKNHILLAALLLSLVLFAGCAQQETDSVDYAAAENWAYHETERTDTAADVFFVCPTVYAGAEDAENMPLDDAAGKAKFSQAPPRWKRASTTPTAVFLRPITARPASIPTACLKTSVQQR